MGVVCCDDGKTGCTSKLRVNEGKAQLVRMRRVIVPVESRTVISAGSRRRAFGGRS
jgi:hypothetical protein